MNLDWLKQYMPRGLYGRAALILVIPVAVLLLAVSYVFFQRHFEDVTRQLTGGVVLQLREVVEQVEAAPDLATGVRNVQPVVDTLRIDVTLASEREIGDTRRFYDVSGRTIIETLRSGLPGILAIDLKSSGRWVDVQIQTAEGPINVRFSRRRASASNPHQFLVLIMTIGALMTGIAFLYLRNQLRPITRLADAADAFGKGRVEPYRPSGAVEVRAAGRAFLDMRGRILRQIEQRTLVLSGVSHDLRTPLTRMKLTLSLMDDSAETADLARDVAEMERLIDAFLDFSRTDHLDDPAPVAPAELARDVIERARRGGGSVELVFDETADEPVILRHGAVDRALSNLVGNALRYAGSARVSVILRERQVLFRVEDDGPGIPEDLREEAMKPFIRLDPSRNQDRGSGVGLGLAIANDIARRHGGVLRLGRSEDLGGLRADLTLPR